MKRDITASIATIILIASLILGGGEITNDTFEIFPRPLEIIFMGALILALLRLLVLWFQTLIDAARPKDQKDAKVGWIIAHVVFGPLASCTYYYLYVHFESPLRSEEDVKRSADEGKL